MKAILLAAGKGVRLYPYTKDRPKCMMEFGQKTLVEISLENLAKAGIEKVFVVVGYKHEMIEERLKLSFSPDFYQTIYNPDYVCGSGSSLMCAADAIDGEILTVESDLLYSWKIIKRVIDRKGENILTLGHFNHGRKEVKIYLENGFIKKAAWGLPDDIYAAGDWVGFSRFSEKAALSLKSALKSASLSEGKEIHYEDFIFNLISQFQFSTTPVDDLPWIEIDNEEDLMNARRNVYPKLMAAYEEPVIAA